jgi:putative endonuclease
VTRVELGRRAELAVADCLFAAGFDLVVRNVRLGALELDIVARRGPLLVIAEVRTRGPCSRVGPFASVTRTKRKRILRATERFWRSNRHDFASIERVRIDVAAVTFVGRETHVEYAAGAISG